MLSAQSFSPRFRDLIGAGLIWAHFREAFGRLPAVSLERARETGTGRSRWGGEATGEINERRNRISDRL